MNVKNIEQIEISQKMLTYMKIILIIYISIMTLYISKLHKYNKHIIKVETELIKTTKEKLYLLNIIEQEKKQKEKQQQKIEILKKENYKLNELITQKLTRTTKPNKTKLTSKPNLKSTSKNHTFTSELQTDTAKHEKKQKEKLKITELEKMTNYIIDYFF